MSRTLKIAILTNGRFHVCDLARELAALGHQVAFYSLVPPWRTRQFGLPTECNRWLLPYVMPWFAATRAARSLGRNSSQQWFTRRLSESLERVAAHFVERCDVVIAMSGLFTLALSTIRRRYGAKVWIERGSRHILSQKAILDAIPGAERVTDGAVKRELCDYEQADTVVVLSRHCEQSFEDYGYPSTKVFRNSLGVSLKMFSPTLAPPTIPATVLMTGQWSLRKGCDVLVEAWRRLPGVRLLHVGSVNDCPLPTDPRFTHYDPVDQPVLRQYYATGHVFALASREEGMATVQPQALACGLKLVCTDRTGGEDLKEFVSDPNDIQVTPANCADKFSEALRKMLASTVNETGIRDRLGRGREQLSWAASGKRYEAELLRRL